MNLERYSPRIRALKEEYDQLVGRSDPAAIRVLQKLRKEAVSLKDDLLLGNTYYGYAFVEYFIRGRYDSYLNYLRKSARCLMRCDDPTELAHVYYLIALDAMNKRMFDVACNEFLQARDLFLKAGDENSAAILNMSIGHILLQLSDYRKARDYLKKALRVIKQNKQHPHYFSNTAAIRINDCLCCIGLQNQKQAESLFRQISSFFALHGEKLRVGMNLDYALLGARLSLMQGNSRALDDYRDAILRWLPETPQLVTYVEEFRNLCIELLAAGEVETVGSLQKAFPDSAIPADAAYAQLMLSQIRSDYCRAAGDTKKLRLLYKTQTEIRQRLIAEQQQAYLHRHDLNRLISELQEEQMLVQEEHQSLMYIAVTDALTNIPNRAALDSHLDQAFERALFKETTLGVSLIDIDGLKAYNDTYGHIKGDQRLIEFAALLKEPAKDPRIFAARYGGDEFVVVYEGMTDDEIMPFAQALSEKSTLRISQGICNQVPEESNRIWDFLNCADRAMYEAKKASRKSPNSAGIRFRTIRPSGKKQESPESTEGSLSNQAFSAEQLRRYIDQTSEIRSLSSPQILDMNSADNYRTRLLQNFVRIRELSSDNVGILNRYFHPALKENSQITREALMEMRQFSDELVDAYNLKNLDSTLIFHMAERLLKEAELLDNDEAMILALDGMVTAAYLIGCITMRLTPVSDYAFKYFRIGREASERLLEFLDHDRFLSLSVEMRELIVINARYIRMVSEIDDVPGDPVQRDICLQRMKAALAMADDPFYREQLPDYDWDLHVFRTYEYICSLTDLNNNKQYTPEQLRYIHDCTKKMKAFYDAREETYREIHQIQTLPLYLSRNSYLVGETDLKTYKAFLKDLIYQDFRDDQTDSLPMVMLQASLEYILVLDPAKGLTKEEEECLYHLYHKLVGYMHQTPKKDMLSFFVSWLFLIMKYYIETPNTMTLEEFGLSLIAALFPTTYVHALSVANLSKVLTHHLAQKEPERFACMPGFKTAKDVKKRLGELESFAFHSAMCHDFGKLLITETILTYGRDLLDIEFDFIKTHPSIGAYLLERQNSTKAYADIARGHHKWHNDRGGYPEDFSLAESPYRPMVEIITVADCLDAATDSIGRSYKDGKTLNQIIVELDEGSGTRYAPFVVQLLHEEAVHREVAHLLTEGRNENYRKTYTLLLGNLS